MTSLVVVLSVVARASTASRGCASSRTGTTSAGPGSRGVDDRGDAPAMVQLRDRVSEDVDVRIGQDATGARHVGPSSPSWHPSS